MVATIIVGGEYMIVVKVDNIYGENISYEMPM